MKKLVVKDYKELEKKLKNADEYISDQEVLKSLGMAEGYQIRASIS